MNYPHNDDYMIFDYKSHRYILTEKDVEENLGINLVERNENEVARRNLLNLCSQHVYNYIHSHNISTGFQDYIIAKTETGRAIIKEAMEHQLVYIMSAGDLSRVPDVNLRALWFDEQAKQALLKEIPEIGTTILYTGKFPPYVPNGAW